MLNSYTKGQAARAMLAFGHLFCLLGTTLSIITNGTSFGAPKYFVGETIHRVGTCYDGNPLVEVRFDSEKPPFVLMTICHDEKIDMTLWAQHFIVGTELENSQGGGKRPSFQEGGFYPTISADDCYKQKTQNETLGMLVGTSLAGHYLQTGFLERGHLVPNGDPITAVQKAATFYFINASPQWKTINGGNWEKFETKLRELAKTTRSKFTVWTGSYGITTLNDVSGNPVEIWLGRDSNKCQGKLVKKLPVNHLTWKMIYEPWTNTGVVVIMINNPWIDYPTYEDIICENVCDKLEWVTWNTSDVVQGYTYCCTVASFKQRVPHVPDLGNISLLLKNSSLGHPVLDQSALFFIFLQLFSIYI